MRATNLVKVAAQAEILRLQLMLKRQVVRAAFGLAAMVFILGALALANIAGWQVARFYFVPIYATLIMLGVNLLIAMIFGLLAVRLSPSKHEREAFEVRQRALREARSSLALGAVIPVASALLRSRRESAVDRRPFWRLGR
jgi:hypothetical protein